MLSVSMYGSAVKMIIMIHIDTMTIQLIGRSAVDATN